MILKNKFLIISLFLISCSNGSIDKTSPAVIPTLAKSPTPIPTVIKIEFKHGDLTSAVMDQQFEQVKSLIESGAEVNELSTSNWIPIFYAARHGNTEIGKYLIEHGANLNWKSFGKTYLDIAKDFNHPDYGTSLSGAVSLVPTKLPEKYVDVVTSDSDIELVPNSIESIVQIDTALAKKRSWLVYSSDIEYVKNKLLEIAHKRKELVSNLNKFDSDQDQDIKLLIEFMQSENNLLNSSLMLTDAKMRYNGALMQASMHGITGSTLRMIQRQAQDQVDQAYRQFNAVLDELCKQEEYIKVKYKKEAVYDAYRKSLH